ncbi:carboxymuconolactone decarboxylase family protein [Pontixanthobacter aquaemixtae]|uniref:Carboxymuconolactone decarboxylase family protein n=1 Tax=Pontixanthobacter aquaemixtae TaxID=1958940 RepID=A0A844ZT22_9SPHN|nr:carboxymuconolactone decarboxylase family protein [Pontixanthobacter aquaemixtae]MXO89957.1 carboxymuconolactone decarboxylase family protein [Pontixanthobacter aquaemixtae]
MTDDTKIRIGHLPREEWTDDAREVFAFWGEPNAWEEGSKTNIMMVMGNHPPLGKVFNIWGKHFLMENTLSTRQLEILVLRVSVRAKSIYEWHNHVGYAMNAGISLEEIAAIRDYPEGGDWSEEEGALIRAVDELVDQHKISDATWATLSKTLSTQQLMDTIFTIGHYVMTSWAISSMGVPVEGGADVIGFDLKTASGKTPGGTFKPGETDDWVDSRGY